jgi:GTP diphosphokinase / guanosine-3',5'-bis(diphosphate) 3'-diphosphatase
MERRPSVCWSEMRDRNVMDHDPGALEDAIELAFTAHRGQVYPVPEREPYVLHLFRVMLAVDSAPARMAAVLHDVLEDTTMTADELLNAGVSRTVVDAVVALTHCPKDNYDEYIERVADHELAREVKLADLADNLANNESLPRTPDVVARINRYKRAMRRLTSADDHAGRRRPM